MTYKREWVKGNINEGVSVQRMAWHGKPQWRVQIWKNGRQYRYLMEYDSRKEAMQEARSIARNIRKYGYYE